jgi:hypothetical protein
VLINAHLVGWEPLRCRLPALGAAEITGVCGIAQSELVRSIGADKVIDYTQTDFTKRAAIRSDL